MTYGDTPTLPGEMYEDDREEVMREMAQREVVFENVETGEYEIVKVRVIEVPDFDWDMVEDATI